MTPHYLCIFCWRDWPAGGLFYTCPECEREDRALPAWARSSEEARTGRPVASLHRPWWRRRSLEKVEEACLRHPGTEIHLYCECGAPITRAAAVGRRGPLAIGFAGPTSAGKTLFTLAAIRRLRGVRIDGRRVSLLGLGDTEERFGALESSLFGDHLKPKSTPEQFSDGERTMNFAWEVSVSEDGTRRRGRDALLAINDLAGETWGTPSHESHELLDSYLEHIGGVVFLVDGASLADDLGLESDDAWQAEPRPGDRGAGDRQWLRWLVERLGPRARHVDLALTVSKGDLLWTHEKWSELKPPPNDGFAASVESDAGNAALLRQALDAAGRGDLPESVQGHFRRSKLFIASSLGFRPGPDDVDAAGPAGRLLRPPEPLQVEAPVLWLLSQRVRNLS